MIFHVIEKKKNFFNPIDHIIKTKCVLDRNIFPTPLFLHIDKLDTKYYKQQQNY